MVKMLFFALSLFIGHSVIAQIDEVAVIKEAAEFQIEQTEHYKNRKTSPLKKKARKKFDGHKFFPISADYAVKATFQRIIEKDTIEMTTATGMVKYYEPYAKLSFKLNGEACQLIAYQSLKLREINEYKHYLFVPFRDATSGEESYGGGRYLDITIPDGNSIILNFNLAYNPYCAYTDGYNCAIPPAENTLSVAVKAGLMTPEEGH